MACLRLFPVFPRRQVTPSSSRERRTIASGTLRRTRRSRASRRSPSGAAGSRGTGGGARWSWSRSVRTRVTERMGGRRGSAIVLAMLLLVLFGALGMYAVSLPVATGEGLPPHYPPAVARNMARAGAHAGIALLPAMFPDAAPYVRRMPVGSNATGRYSVTSRRIDRKAESSGVAPAPGFSDYLLVSEGSAPGFSGAGFRVRAEVRVGPFPAPSARARILRWEESGPR